MRQIINDLYKKKSHNFKYIPVLVPKCTHSDVPHFLRSPKCYTMPKDYDMLMRRIHRVETYELPTIVKEKKRFFKPRFIKADKLS